jgi:Tol biopolymer transport system component/tRNA A-37 threonylcarbamoyl transferase component Bud32
MALTSGTKLGPYEIVAPLGAGGMGEVYRAKDGRLGRDVALKILPESLAQDADRLRRFEQEARTVATLNHPNILAVFDIGRDNGSPYLVSELLEGESLRDVLEHGALPQRKTIDYGVQIAHGLAAAHEKGIVHRDLKPENIFVTRDGRIKILDFGLAKLAQKLASDSSANEVTLDTLRTAVGSIVGTASYMAPEQVRGEATDARTDIFAFGAVLYEMLSGVSAFRRGTPAETMTAVLKDDPPGLSDPGGRAVSLTLDRIVHRCLEKSPEQRFQSARDLSFALSALSGTETSGVVPATAPAASHRSILPWVGVVLAMAVTAGVTWFLARRPAPAGRMQFAISVPDEMSISHMALSRDGTMLVFVSPEETSSLPMLFVQRVGSPNVTPLPGTQGASFPFWSPDGAYVGFFANGKLQKTAISGGAPQVLATALSGRGGSWGNKGVIIYAEDAQSSLSRINADGTGKAPLTRVIRVPADQSHRWPVFLADGDHFLFWAGNFGNLPDDRSSGIYLSSLEAKERKLVVLCHSSFGYDAHHLYYADGQRQLVGVAFDPSSATVSGGTTVIANAIGFQPSTYWAALTVAQNGTLIYSTSVGAAQSELTWMDRSGKELGHVGDPGIMANPTLSPDGARVALDITDQKANNVDVWIESTTGSGSSRFTFDPSEEVVGVWSRDGRTLAYRGAVVEGTTLFLKAASGLQRERKRFTLQSVITDDFLPNSWTADDQQILCTRQNAAGDHLELLPVDGGDPVRFMAGNGSQTNGQISPDGRWVAYASDESGVWEIYVTSFPGAAGKWQVSRGGGSEPRWRGDGKEIFYIAPSGILTAVPVNGEGIFATGTPAPLFQIHGRAPISSTDVFTYDVAKDGKRFLVNRYVKPEHVPPLTILLDTANRDQSH